MRRRRSRVLTVSLPVPKDIYVPRTVRYLPSLPLMFNSRFRRVSLTPPRPADLVRRKVRVVVPKRRETARAPSAWAVNRYGELVVASRRSVKRLFSGVPPEWNRLRRAERKERRHKFRHGQVESVRGDRAGIIAATVLGGGSPARIADAAMVSRALGYS